nr:immunoglobulin heavy chain junction region [Macaca mulatta]MOX60744.1 immunoglobulin heavy chain junction region [Macaca mulatta]
CARGDSGIYYYFDSW